MAPKSTTTGSPTRMGRSVGDGGAWPSSARRPRSCRRPGPRRPPPHGEVEGQRELELGDRPRAGLGEDAAAPRPARRRRWRPPGPCGRSRPCPSPGGAPRPPRRGHQLGVLQQVLPAPLRRPGHVVGLEPDPGPPTVDDRARTASRCGRHVADRDGHRLVDAGRAPAAPRTGSGSGRRWSAPRRTPVTTSTPADPVNPVR